MKTESVSHIERLNNDLVEQTQCPGCGSTRFKVVAECDFIESNKGMSEIEASLSRNLTHLNQCQDCHLSYRSAFPSDTDLAQLYESLPEKRWETSIQTTAWQLATSHINQKANSSQFRVLDVGAFDGSFLAGLSSEIRKFAVEPGDALEQTLSDHGIERIGGFLGEVDQSLLGTFDIVTLFDVFEHLKEPEATLAQALDLLKPGGQLILSTGNSEHWSWNMLTGKHWYVRPIQHLVFGSVSYFRSYARRHALVIDELKTHSHRKGHMTDRFPQAIDTIHYSFLRGGRVAKILGKVLGYLPGRRSFFHRTSAPHTPDLKDHVFVVFSKEIA